MYAVHGLPFGEYGSLWGVFVLGKVGIRLYPPGRVFVRDVLAKDEEQIEEQGNASEAAEGFDEQPAGEDEQE